MNKDIQVEILLATYNGEKYLIEQIESIIKQSHRNWVLKIRDDDSSDNTLKIINSYCHSYPDKIFLIKGNGTGKGAKNNFWELIKSSSGDVVMCCDQDDVWHENKIERTLIFFNKGSNNTPRLVYTDLNVVDENLTNINDSFQQFSGIRGNRNTLNFLLCENVVTGCTMMFNNILRDQVLRLENIETIKMHDYWIALVASAIGEIEYLGEPTIHYRQHENNVVGARGIDGIFKIKHLIESYKKAVSNNIYYIEQAKILYQYYNLNLTSENRELLYDFMTLKNKNKIARMATMVKYKIYKYNLIKRLGLILTI